VGKDTVIDAWRRADPRVRRVVAYTTRSPRPGEQEGIDYHFVTPERFLAMAEAGAFLEHKEVHGAHYATPLADLEAMLAEGLIAVLKIDVQGALDVMARRPEAISIFLAPPSTEELERRLRGRGTEDAATAERRLRNALAELEQAPRYQHVVVNDSVESAVAELVRLSSD
jgi:guanylate kinase